MKACVHNPYLDTLGGGERYTFAVAQVLSEAGYKVDVEWKNTSLKQTIEERFGMKLKDIDFIESINRGSMYDVCFWLSDGSIPTLFARKNILHFQRPFYKVDGKNLLNKMKFFRINKIIANSNFTKEWIDREYGIESFVIYPPVSVEKFKSKKKENVILYVGRFSQLEQAKRQDVLVEAFKKLYDSSFRKYRLVLAGASDVGKTKYIKELKKRAEGYPIEILENLMFSEIKELYSKAKIFWSASGYGINESKLPQKVEHFGISLVEGMAAGVVPLAYSGGGHKEIIQHEVNGFLWRTKDKLIDLTATLLENNKLWGKMSARSKKDSQKYSFERFKKEFLNLLQ